METARQLQKMLALATTEGIGKKAYLDGWGSAGKTGSAQTAGGVNAWFCGYTPVRQPRYVVAVFVKNGASGSETAAPLFKEIAERIWDVDPAGCKKINLEPGMNPT